MSNSIWDSVHQEPPTEYIDLGSVISFDGFDHKTYALDELEILQPRLEAMGYREVSWFPGEMDCFGPLTRLCRAMKNLEAVWFVYG